MTEKQEIIINGVDVSGCDFLAKEDIYNSYSGVTTAYKGQCGCSDDEMCKDHRNCGYKKLARQLQRKTQECEELKEELATYEKMLDNTEFRIALTDVRTGEREVWRKLGRKADRYRKALDEIERICLEDVHIFADGTELRYDSLDDILDIINKLKGGNDE